MTLDIEAIRQRWEAGPCAPSELWPEMTMGDNSHTVNEKAVTRAMVDIPALLAEVERLENDNFRFVGPNKFGAHTKDAYIDELERENKTLQDRVAQLEEAAKETIQLYENASEHGYITFQLHAAMGRLTEALGAGEG